MAGRKFSLTEYFNARCAEMEPLFAFNASTEAEARKWRGRALAKIRDLLGETPEWTPLEAEVLQTADMGSYVREKIVYDSDPYSTVPAYMLIPKNLTNPTAAVLCLHGHGPGKDAVAGITDANEQYTPQEVARSIEQHNYDYARQFVERGYVTFTFDFRCFGERASRDCDIGNRDPCNVHFIRGALLGINTLALAIHDAVRAIDYLSERPEVDASRIGCVGLSFGGTMTMWTTAMDKRIKAAVISGYLCEFASFAVRKANFCGSQFVPALRRYFDVADVAALIAPRPLLIESGIQDNVFPIDSAIRAFERLKIAYDTWEKPERLAHDVFEGGHRFHGPEAYKWFDRWL